MKTIPLALTLTALAFCSAKAQVPDSEQPLQVAGKVTMIDSSGHHIGVETADHQSVMLVYDTGLSVVDQAGKALAISAIQNGIPVTIMYADIKNAGRLLATKVVVWPLPPAPPANSSTHAPNAVPSAP